MTTNKLGYLGLLGLTGLIGFIDPWMFAFFSFFTLFVFLKSDERIEQNIGRASRNAFIYYTIIATATMAYILTVQTYNAMPAFAALLSQGLTVFTVSYWLYQKGDYPS
ncbi:MAG: DUF3796 domain-containing protein [Candidatus Bathyarchaeota archaeon]|nr:DUF3796 domain-containing protein [Candidatus Bathyarchaeota archaeon]